MATVTPACRSPQAGSFSGHLFQNEAPAQFSDYQTEDEVELRYLDCLGSAQNARLKAAGCLGLNQKVGEAF